MSAIDRIMAAQVFDKGSYLTLAEGRIPSEQEKNDAAKCAELLAVVKNGEYTLQIDKIEYRSTSQTIGEMIAVEFTVLASNTDKSPAGTKRAWVQSLAKAVGVSAYKAFLYAALGAKTEEQKVQADKVLPSLLLAIEQKQKHNLLGRKIQCSVLPHKTKDGKYVTINRYAPSED